MLRVLALTGLLTGLIATPATAAAPTVPPGAVTIDSVAADGSTCRPGTTSIVVSLDKTAFTVLYSAYLAQVGGGAVPADAHQKCNLKVTVHAPDGYTYAIDEADYRGYAFLTAGATAVEQARYQFQGDPDKPLVAHSWTGPFDDDWQNTDATAGALVYAPCGKTRTLAVDTQLTVSASGSADSSTASLVTMDSTDGSLAASYHFTWKRCG